MRSFRLQWFADLLTSWSFEMETLILGWYVLVETGSVLMLTLFGALQYLGTLIAPVFGVVGDRIGHRNLLCGMRAAYTTFAALLMILAFARLLDPTVVLIIAAMAGIVRPSDQGLRGALIAETMPTSQMTVAMGISRTTSDSARVAGALAGAGLFAALGMGPAYAVVTLFYGLGLLLTFQIPEPVRVLERAADATSARQRFSPWRDLKEGLLYVWTAPQLQAAIWLAFLFNLTAFPVSNGLLPYVAKEVYRTDQTGLGYLAASVAFGAVLGSIFVSIAGSRIRPARTMIIFAAVWYLLLLVFAQAQTLLGGSSIIFAAGFVQSFSLVPLMVILLRTSDDRFRGRVMGLRMLAIYSLPVGLLVAGALIGRFGFAATATFYAATGLLFTFMIALRWRAALWDLQAVGNAR